MMVIIRFSLLGVGAGGWVITNLQTIERVSFFYDPTESQICISLPARDYCEITAPYLPVEEMGIRVENTSYVYTFA